jgi:hypothetical protein
MSERSVTFKIVKYLLISKICVIIVISFIYLVALIVFSTHSYNEKNSPEEEVLYYYHKDSTSLDRMLFFLQIFKQKIYF